MGLRRRDREGGRRDWATDRTAADSGRLPGREAQALSGPQSSHSKPAQAIRAWRNCKKNRFAKLFAVIAHPAGLEMALEPWTFLLRREEACKCHRCTALKTITFYVPPTQTKMWLMKTYIWVLKIWIVSFGLTAVGNLS